MLLRMKQNLAIKMTMPCIKQILSPKICFLFCKVVVKFDVILNNMTCHFDIGDDATNLLACLKIECIRNRKIMILMISKVIIACS